MIVSAVGLICVFTNYYAQAPGMVPHYCTGGWYSVEADPRALVADWNSRGSSVMTPSTPRSRIRSISRRLFTVQA